MNVSSASWADTWPDMGETVRSGQLQTGHAVCFNSGVYSQLFNNILGFDGLERYAAEGGGFGDPRYLEGGPLSLGL